MDYMLLKIQDTVKIDGETQLSGFAKCIEVMSFSHGVSNPIQSSTSNTGRTIGRPHLQELTLSKVLDATTPHLNFHCAKGTNLGKIELHLVRQDGSSNGDSKNAYAYMVYELTEAMISSVSVGGGGGQPMETLSLNFSKMTWTYKPQETKTGAKGNVTHSWDQALNTGS
jgi:type VI secretion system secreted protein Hcp